MNTARTYLETGRARISKNLIPLARISETLRRVLRQGNVRRRRDDWSDWSVFWEGGCGFHPSSAIPSGDSGVSESVVAGTRVSMNYRTIRTNRTGIRCLSLSPIRCRDRVNSRAFE